MNVCIVLLDRINNRILMVKNRERGIEFPGGKSENQDILNETIINIKQVGYREFMEETNYRIENMQIEDIHYVSDANTLMLVSTNYKIVRNNTGDGIKSKLDEVIVESKWWDIDDILDGRCKLSYESDRAYISILVKKLHC